MTSQITGVSIVCSTVCSGVNQENIKATCHWPLSGEFTGDWKGPVTRNIFPFDDVIMYNRDKLNKYSEHGIQIAVT